MSNLETILVTTKEDLLQYRDKICLLFHDCFSSKMSLGLWEWAYINNIYGPPVVALSFDGDRLVAHYAVIRNDLANQEEGVLKTGLSMTTMVAESHRKHYLFTALAELVYDELKSQSFNLVCGFPNEMSVPGFKKRLQWTILESSYIAKITKEQLVNSSKLIEYINDTKRFGFDYSNKSKLKWRTSKPEVRYETSPKGTFKSYEGQIDLMYLTNEIIQSLDYNSAYNILLDSSIIDLEKYKVFDYPFGYRSFDGENYDDLISLSMIMSDVF